MNRLVLLAALCGLLVGLPLCADDPPKKLTAEERKELEAKWREHMIAGTKAYQGRKLAEAMNSLQDALEIARRLYPKSEFPDGHHNLATNLNNVARLLLEQGEFNEAERLLRDVLDMHKRLFKGDHLYVADSLNNLASVLNAQSKASEAEQLYRDGLAMRKRLVKGDHPDVARGMNNLSVVLKGQGKLVESAEFARDALEMRKRLVKGDHPDVAQSLNALGSVLTTEGKLAEAEPLFRAALDMRKRLHEGDHPEVAACVGNLAALLTAQGKLADAEVLFRDALDMRKRLHKGDHRDVAQALNNLAALLQKQRKLTDAEPLFRQALEMNRRLFKSDHRDVALNMSNLATLFQDRGRLADAESLYRDALDMRKRLFKGDHSDVAHSLSVLASFLTAQERYPEAEPLLRAALDMEKRLFKGDHLGVAQSLNDLAFLLQETGRLADAESLYREALDIRKRLYKGDHADVANSLSNLAVLLWNQGKLADAETLTRDALEMTRRLFKGDHLDVARNLNNLAFLLKERSRATEAEPLHRNAVAMSRRLMETTAQQQTEGEVLTSQAALPTMRNGLLTLARDAQADAATVYPEVWPDKAALARVYERRQLAARTVTDPQTAKLMAELADARRRRANLLLAPEVNDPATRKQRENDLKELDTKIVDLDRTLRPLLPAVERAEKLGKATPDDLRRVLPADTALVDFLKYTYFEYDKMKPGRAGERKTWRYLAFLITKDKIAWVDLETADTIEPAVDGWREAITSGKDIPPAIPAKVRELVWAKVAKELPANIKTIYIAPDVALCRLPWAALPGDKPGTILLEDFAIATIPHATFLLDKLWPQAPPKNPPTGALGVGGVNYEAEPTVGPVNRELPVKPGAKIAWPALPGATAEAAGFVIAAKQKGEVTLLSGEKATPAAVLAALPKARYAHFATHGFFADPSFRSAFQLDDKDFQRSTRGERIGRAALSPLVMTGLVFAGANNPKTPGRGILTGEALIDLDLSGLELAVLSACETGLGDVAGGEGTFGLQRAFHLAGTRDVVASLWKVPDQPTAALMAEFYRNLWEKNLSPLAALREAQLTIYRNPAKIAELAAGFRAGFKEVPGTEVAIKPTAEGKTHPRLWAAFTLSGLGR